MRILLPLLAITCAYALENGRYAESYSQRRTRCAPCDFTDRFRGNGADNLGYDWSPKAWGGPAFPKPEASRSGRKMPSERPCSGCLDWVRGTTEQPGNNNEATVTSPTLGVILRDNRNEEGRTMRWDGFRNGMPEMERRDWNDLDIRFRDDTSKGYSGWDSSGKGHYFSPNKNYASGWSYGSPNREWNGSPDRRPWNAYPTTERYPSSNNYRPGTVRPQDLITDNRPYYKYPESTFRPGYPSTEKPSWEYPNRPNNWPQDNRPSNQNYQPQQPYRPPPKGGYYTGFITEINDRDPGDHYNNYPTNRPQRPDNRYPYRPENNRYPNFNELGNKYPLENRDKPHNYYPTDNQPPNDNHNRPYDYNDRRPPPFYQNRYPDTNKRPDPYPSDQYRPAYFPNRDRPGYYPNEDYLPPNRRPEDNRPGYYPNKRPEEERPWYANKRPEHERPGYYPNGRPEEERPGYYPNKRPEEERPGYYPNKRPEEERPGYYPNKRPEEERPGYYPNRRPEEERPGYYPNRRPDEEDSNSWNYSDRDMHYKRAGGSYPPYKGGHYYTASFQNTTPTSHDSNESGSTTQSTNQE